MQQMWKGYISI